MLFELNVNKIIVFFLVKQNSNKGETRPYRFAQQCRGLAQQFRPTLLSLYVKQVINRYLN